MKNEVTCQVLFLGYLLQNLCIFWVNNIITRYHIFLLCDYINNILVMESALECILHVRYVVEFFQMVLIGNVVLVQNV